MVLLGIRTSLKTDFHCFSADLVYDTTLRLPGELLVPAPNAAPCSAQDFAALLRRTCLTCSQSSLALPTARRLFTRIWTSALTSPSVWMLSGSFSGRLRTKKTED